VINVNTKNLKLVDFRKRSCSSFIHAKLRRGPDKKLAYLGEGDYMKFGNHCPNVSNPGSYPKETTCKIKFCISGTQVQVLVCLATGP
jgi:hypothetical protein